VIRRALGLSAAAFVVTVACSTAARASEATASESEHRRGERRESEQREAAIIEHLRVGPLVGIGFPRPFAIEPFAKFEKIVGIGAEYSFLPTMNILGAETRFKAVAADLRVFPFQGAFFIGARVGRQWLDAKATLTVSRLGSFTESMTAATWFVNPRIGFLFTFDSGMTIGIDAGVQLPVTPSYERAGPATSAGLVSAKGGEINQTVARVAGALGNNVTPTLDLLRLGFLF
jgi:hypothetical protein